MFTKISIKGRISIIFILVISFLMLISNILIYFTFKGIFHGQIVQDLNNVMKQNSWNMDTLVNSINQAAIFLCTDKTVAETMNKQMHDKVDMIYTTNEFREEFINHIAIPLNGVIQYYQSSLFIDNNLPFSSYFPSDYEFTDDMKNTTSGVYSSLNVASEKWYINACELNGGIYTFTLGDDRQTLYMARSVSNPYLINKSRVDGFMGVVVFSFDISQIGHQIQSAELTPSTRIFLTDGDGTILYSNNYEELQSNLGKYMNFSLLQGYSRQKSFTIEFQKQKYITNVNNLKYGWNLVAMIPNRDIAGRMSIIKNIIFSETIISIVLGIILSIMFSKNITEPIIRLAMVMKSINSKEYFDVFVETRSKDEVGLLYQSFNNMMRRINKLVDEVIKHSRLQREAELKALQAQINPHFLYNTLDSVSWLALCEGNDSIVTIVSSLADIMRFNIKDPNNLVTIEEEICNVKNYINIQLIRYDNNFNVQYDIEQEILKIKVPKLMLQPLVENAIIHGVEKVEELGNIVVAGIVCGNNIIISVADNGIGANVDELNDYLDGKNSILSHSDGFGIKNVNERIRMCFGEDYGLRFKVNGSRGITAVITIPYGI